MVLYRKFCCMGAWTLSGGKNRRCDTLIYRQEGSHFDELQVGVRNTRGTANRTSSDRDPPCAHTVDIYTSFPVLFYHPTISIPSCFDRRIKITGLLVSGDKGCLTVTTTLHCNATQHQHSQPKSRAKLDPVLLYPRAKTLNDQ